MDWERLVSLELYHFLFVFARVGGAFLFMPFFASTYAPNRVRLLFALALAVVLTPSLGQYLPPQPKNVPDLMTAIDLTGVNAAMATSFSNATVLDPQTNVQSTVLTSFLTLTAVLLIVVTDLHHVMLGAVLASYKIFPAGQALLTGDMTRTLARTLGQAFVCGFEIGSPFIVMIVLLYSSMGVMSRLMPQLNIMFVIMPLQVWLGLALTMVSLPMMMWWFLEFFQDGLRPFAL